MSRKKYNYIMVKNGIRQSCSSVIDMAKLLNSELETDIYTADKLRNYFTRRPKHPKGFKNMELIRILSEKKTDDLKH